LPKKNIFDGDPPVISLRSTHATLRRLIVLLALSLGLVVTTGSTGFAADYPLPTSGQGQVTVSIVQVGHCTTFFGSGFQPGSTVTITDNGIRLGTAKASNNGAYAYTVCYATNAKLGPHTLNATGTGGNGAARTLTAIVHVVGVQLTDSGAGQGASNSGAGQGASTSDGGGEGGLLPFTGSDILSLVLFGAFITALGMVLTHRGQKARSERRRAASA
jgi:hypothetical protein